MRLESSLKTESDLVGVTLWKVSHNTHFDNTEDVYMTTGTLLSGTTHYYYGDARFHAKYPYNERCLADTVPELHNIEEEDRPSVRRRKAKEAGFTGLSILHRLYHLYGFDILKDTVFDAMHNVVLNVVRQHLQYYIEKGMLPKGVETCLNRFPWTAGQDIAISCDLITCT